MEGFAGKGSFGQLDLEEAFADGSFASAKKRGGQCVGKANRGKGTKWMRWSMAKESLAELISIGPRRVRWATGAIEKIAVPRRSRGRPGKNLVRIVADKGYDSDLLRERLAERGIELICPDRINNKKKKHQDGCKLRRYKRRWTVERTIHGCKASADWLSDGAETSSLPRLLPASSYNNYIETVLKPVLVKTPLSLLCIRKGVLHFT